MWQSRSGRTSGARLPAAARGWRRPRSSGAGASSAAGDAHASGVVGPSIGACDALLLKALSTLESLVNSDGQPAMVTARAPDARSAAARKVAHLLPEERVARGKAARNETPRSSHGWWEPAADRPDPVALLEQQGRTRVPELVPIRYGRMLVSPFTFYRGAALIMASDLASTPRSGLNVQVCGDAHLSNFGVFASPERQLMFDINDFDETLPGPWEWDVKRLTASFEIAGRDRGFAERGPARDRHGVRRRVPRPDAAARGRCATSTSGTPTSRSTGSSRS